ncbi:hypothetical protein NPIL_363081 [Nephila pilipes]|uniref:Uncharacterized protein n=1 Tax=Nephila pilipes TaxID=299642 RepID=A0A8X6PZU3_NEPPI|nr:hypothetical protein NPIL_363081 [Nephila pilipes]
MYLYGIACRKHSDWRVRKLRSGDGRMCLPPLQASPAMRKGEGLSAKWSLSPHRFYIQLPTESHCSTCVYVTRCVVDKEASDAVLTEN